jgi:hypothetical protein
MMERRAFLGSLWAAAAAARPNYCDAGIAPGGKSNGSASAGYICRIDL